MHNENRFLDTFCGHNTRTNIDILAVNSICWNIFDRHLIYTYYRHLTIYRCLQYQGEIDYFIKVFVVMIVHAYVFNNFNSNEINLLVQSS